MPKKYRLKKEFAGIPAGTEFEYVGDNYKSSLMYLGEKPDPHFGRVARSYLIKLPAPLVENNQDWFEPMDKLMHMSSH